MATGEPTEDGTLTRYLLKSASNEFDLESIHTLNLSGRDLSDISIIGRCTNLEKLDLSRNNISRLHALSNLTLLVTLDLSANRITVLDGLGGLDKVEMLNIAGNLIGSISALRPLETLRSLKHLRMNDVLADLSNPICVRRTYREEVTSLLPDLLSLDGEYLKGADAEVFKIVRQLEQQIDLAALISGRHNKARIPVRVPDDLCKLNQPITEDSENRIRPIINECLELNKRADQLIKEAQNRLSKSEKV